MRATLHPKEPETIDCETCMSEIPGGSDLNIESNEYVYHFCGLTCYQKWQARHHSDKSDAKDLVGH